MSSLAFAVPSSAPVLAKPEAVKEQCWQQFLLLQKFKSSNSEILKFIVKIWKIHSKESQPLSYSSQVRNDFSKFQSRGPAFVSGYSEDPSAACHSLKA